jgi:hypothetical protein
VTYLFDAEVWLYEGDAPWHFATLPVDVADELRARTAGRRRGFGSIRVQATIGSTTWETSLFPDRKSGSYLLPVKAEIRRREQIEPGDTVTIALDLA